jgi:hypothetical protein
VSGNNIRPREFIQDQLFDWLDGSDTAAAEENKRMVPLLFGMLVEYELFSYANYIQRLIARGEPGLSFTEVSTYFTTCITLLTCGFREMVLAIGIF